VQTGVVQQLTAEVVASDDAETQGFPSRRLDLRAQKVHVRLLIVLAEKSSTC
jgi:hypothetical protein